MRSFIKAFWYLSNNFGDNLNHFLITELSKLPVVYAYDRNQEHYILCGSILSECNKWSTVCGAGLGAEYQRVNPFAKILSVRGKLTADIIRMDIPMGDPALLLPTIYQPKQEKKHKHGVIPHWSDYEYALKTYPGIKRHIIDPFLPVKEFIDEVVSCEQVISSGLHGLIVADAYKIPNAWLNLNNETFKYLDYYSTTNSEVKPLDRIDFEACQVNEYKYDLNELRKSIPFAV